MMEKTAKQNALIMAGIGLIWGLAEIGIGPLMRKTCGSGQSGSMLTGLAYLFITAAYTVRPKISTPLFLLFIVSAVKILSGIFFGIPLFGGAIANPVFAYALEALSFVLVVSIFRRIDVGAYSRWIITGASSAVIAALAFPLVKYCTGIPACAMGGMGVPMSYYYSYYAVGIAAIAAPVGYWMGKGLKNVRSCVRTIVRL